ncbi:hypothetical protein AYI70_g2834 [Smittium culicis]|uniref:Uncharacterized protein n=1 Tax=Smittium culicis TaxID=133412 RepID=A0A1R1Y6F8_9FUNG|nr:hypothetical protein AYI70_g2834 [Smittium culicis]
MIKTRCRDPDEFADFTGIGVVELFDVTGAGAEELIDVTGTGAEELATFDCSVNKELDEIEATGLGRVEIGFGFSIDSTLLLCV